MLNIINLFSLKRDDKIKLDNRENIREEHIQKGLKNYQSQIF